GQDRPGQDRSGRDRARPGSDRARQPERVSAADVEVRFLPERERLRRVAQQLTAGKKAYPLMEIAWQFLARPEACEVQIRPRQKENGITLHQCPICRAAATQQDWVLAHALRDHVEHYFDKEDTLSDPPAGHFVCVARCGLSGTLLGPPNHHSYNIRMEEIRAARYPDLSPAEYEQRVETIRDPAVIEQWKEESRKTTVYRRKGQSESEGIPHAEAVAQIREDVLQSGIREARSVSMPAKVAQRLSDRGLLAAVRQAWEKERRFPSTLLLALRGALGNMRLHIFRVKKRHEYASPIPPRRLDTELVVPALAEMLDFMARQPGCTRRQIREALRSDLSDDQVQENLEFFKPLLWLIERGHVIEFFDGSLAVPVGRRAARSNVK
ncbi:MAG: hypothetical protein O2923_14695, partial [Verrucomicrobia bacterium]|nr:hypothetical protein [Verrucomicrobiota bacterium]